MSFGHKNCHNKVKIIQYHFQSKSPVFDRVHDYTQVATKNVQWTFLGGCLNYVNVFFKAT